MAVAGTNEGEVYFALFGENFDPDEVTKFVGLEPTSTRLKVVPRPRVSQWKVSSGWVQSDVLDVYDLSSKLISDLNPYAPKISEIKLKLGLQAVLQVVLHITTNESVSTPAIGFDTEVISFLKQVGATIDMDTYRNAP